MPVSYQGIDELIYSLHQMAPDAEREVKEEMRSIGVPVVQDATLRFEQYSKNVDFRVRVSGAGLVRVEEAKRKTTGTQPQFGALQMTKALLPARDAKLDQAVVGLEGRIDKIVRANGF